MGESKSAGHALCKCVRVCVHMDMCDGSIAFVIRGNERRAAPRSPGAPQRLCLNLRSIPRRSFLMQRQQALHFFCFCRFVDLCVTSTPRRSPCVCVCVCSWEEKVHKGGRIPRGLLFLKLLRWNSRKKNVAQVEYFLRAAVMEKSKDNRSYASYCTVSVVISAVTMKGCTSLPWPLSTRIRLNSPRAYEN